MATPRASTSHPARGDQIRRIGASSVLGVLLFALQSSSQADAANARFPARVEDSAASDDARFNASPGSSLADDTSAHGPAVSTSDAIIVDDLDRWIQPNCPAAPCPGFGFNKYGEDIYWRENTREGDSVWAGHAFWTGGISNIDESTHSAIWATDQVDGDFWEVLAFVPRLDTSRPATGKARYCVHNTIDQLLADASSLGRGCLEIVIDQASSGGQWVSLGEFEFPDGYGSVTLSDVVDDGSSLVAVLVDAIKWIRVGAPVEADSYLDGYPDDSTFLTGQQVRFCFSVSRPVRIRWSWWDPTNGWHLITEYDDDGRGACQLSDPLGETGLRRIKIEAIEGTRILDFDEVRFTVAEAATSEPAARVNIRMEGGCGRTIDWGERFNYEFESNVRGRVAIFDCHDSLLSNCAALQEQDVVPNEIKTGSYVGRSQADKRVLEARLVSHEGITAKCRYTLRSRPTPTTAPRATPNPIPTPFDTLPVVIVPGYGNSYPFVRTRSPYFPDELDELAALIESVTKIEPVICRYDWTRPNEFTASTRLPECIEDARQNTGAYTVNLVTHSNGALVARSYLQRTESAPVDKLLMIAPPNQGTVDAYYAWEGGTSVKRDIWLIALGDAIIGHCPVISAQCRQEFVRLHLPSMKDLMPVGNAYLKDHSTQEHLPISTMSERNSFLENLNRNSARLFVRLKRVVVYRARGVETGQTIVVKTGRRLDSLWPDGQPVKDDGKPAMPPLVAGPVTTLQGDGRVLTERAGIPGLAEDQRYAIVDFEADHNGVILQAAEAIVSELSGTSMAGEVAQAHGANGSHAASNFQAEKSLPWMFVAKSNAELQVVDSHGRSTGYHDGQVVVEIPESSTLRYPDNVATLVRLNNVSAYPYIVKLRASGHTTYAVSIISGETGERVWFSQGELQAGEVKSLQMSPRFPHSLYVPSLMR